jgi:hypothetical protein
MANNLLNNDLEGVTPIIEGARIATKSGDLVAAEEALMDAHSCISKILKNMKARERQPFVGLAARPSVMRCGAFTHYPSGWANALTWEAPLYLAKWK